MKKALLILTLISTFTFLHAKKDVRFSVFQLNLWHCGTKVPNGYQGIVDVVDEVNADIVFLCEVNNSKTFIPTLINDLEKRGKHYYGDTLGLGVGILSKFKPDAIEKCCVVPGDEHRAMAKARIEIQGKPFCFYSCHLDYKNYECYMPRGYSGTTWQKIEKPITEEAIVLAANRLSYRDESIRAFIQDAQKERDNGYSVILGGDFNEPSHLDWATDTKDLFDHNGAVINWDCSKMLYEAGYRDAYRERYPDAVNYPGFTFPAGNKLAEEAKLERLAWAPEADERDRIDFIYYFFQSPSVTLEKSTLVGPVETVLRNRIVNRDTKDKFLTPKGIWPTDHKGNLAVFKFKRK